MSQRIAQAVRKYLRYALATEIEIGVRIHLHHPQLKHATNNGISA